MQTVVEIRKTGGVGQLELVKRPLALPGPAQVLIRVEATGVAFADVMMREGVYPVRTAQDIRQGTNKMGRSNKGLTPGYDVVGVVENVGDGVSHVTPGQRVVALTQTGGYAQYVIAEAALTLPCPDDIPAPEAVALVLNYLTAYQMLTRSARVRPGETVLIHGAAGGVGEALVQIAALLECKSYGTVSERKLAGLPGNPGFTPINYQKDPFESEIRLYEPEGVDAVFDAIGGQHLKRSYAALRLGGRVVTYGMSTSIGRSRRNLPRAAIELLRSVFLPLTLFVDGKGVLGYNIWETAVTCPQWFTEDLSQLLAYYHAGVLKPRIAKVLPLSEVREAHRLIQTAELAGKIVLVP